MSKESFHYKILWAALSIAGVLIVSGGGALFAQIKRDIEAGNDREVRIATLTVAHESFTTRIERVEAKIDRILDILLNKK